MPQCTQSHISLTESKLQGSHAERMPAVGARSAVLSRDASNTDKSHVSNSLRDEIERKNRMQDAADRGAPVTNPNGYLDLSYLDDNAAITKLSSKRAMSMAGGVDHFRDNLRADTAENEQVRKRKLQRRALYDDWKSIVIESSTCS